MSFAKTIHAAFPLSVATVLAIASFTLAQGRIRFTPPTPPDLGNPGGRGQGGGKRGPCDQKYEGLTALVPLPRPDQLDDRWGLTIRDRPTVWFDVPTGIDAPVLAQWQLRNSTGKAIAKTVFQIPKTPSGVIGLTVPAPLAIGTYQWDLALYCSSSSGQANGEFDIPAIRKGRVQRVAVPPALQQELIAAKTPIDRASIYAKYGIWYDSITTLGTQIKIAKTETKPLVKTWSELLQQQKLASKTSEKITSCCKIQNQSDK